MSSQLHRSTDTEIAKYYTKSHELGYHYSTHTSTTQLQYPPAQLNCVWSRQQAIWGDTQEARTLEALQRKMKGLLQLNTRNVTITSKVKPCKSTQIDWWTHTNESELGRRSIYFTPLIGYPTKVQSRTQTYQTNSSHTLSTTFFRWEVETIYSMKSTI